MTLSQSSSTHLTNLMAQAFLFHWLVGERYGTLCATCLWRPASSAMSRTVVAEMMGCTLIRKMQLWCLEVVVSVAVV